MRALLSRPQAAVCTETGKIKRVVDIAEAPWRVIGLIALPFITAFTNLQQAMKQQQEAHQLSEKGRPPSLRAAPHLPPRAIGRLPCTLERSPSSLEA